MKLYHLFAIAVKKKVDERAAIDRREKAIRNLRFNAGDQAGCPILCVPQACLKARTLTVDAKGGLHRVTLPIVALADC